MAQHDGQFFRRLGKWQIIECQITPLQNFPKKKAQSTDPALDGTCGEFPVLQQINLPTAQFFGA
jgi:hypothetical protein